MIAIAAALVLAQQGAPRTTEGVAKEKQDVPGERRGGGCGDLPSEDDLRKLLKAAPAQGEAGGVRSGALEWGGSAWCASGGSGWATIVDRSGQVCGVVLSTDDPTAPWPGSQAIAVAKAY